MKRFLIPILKICVSVGLVIFLFWRIGIDRLKEALTNADPWYLVIAILVFTISNCLGALQWHLLLKGRGISLPLLKTLSFYIVALFMNNFLIGYIGGDTFRVYDASKASGNTAGALSAVFFDRIIGFTVLTSLAMCAVLVWGKLTESFTTLLAVFALLACWIMALLFFFNKKFARAFVWLFDLILPNVLHSKLKKLYLNVNAYRAQRKLLIQVLALSAVIQFMRILVHYFAGHAVGVEVGIVYFIIFIPVVALAASLPISIGGIGVREQSAVLLFSQVAVTAPAIVAMEFLAYLVGVLATIPGGLIFVARRERVNFKLLKNATADSA